MEKKKTAYSLEKDLLAAISGIQGENERTRMVTGCDFSVFSPNLLHLDENMASRILACFLDPGGRHGQGPLFLRRVFQLLRIPELAKIDASTVSVTVSVERVTHGARRSRRLDIMLEGDTFVLGIENKLGAGEGKDQLTDYLDWLANNHAKKHYYLIYLTPHGRDASEWGLSHTARVTYSGHFFLLSWEKLLDALCDCATKIPPRIAYFIEDFCKSIWKQKIGVNTMEIDKGIVDYLANQTTFEELKAASAIFESYISAANQIILEWVTRLKNKLEPEISGQITVANKFEYKEGEIDYLIIAWPEWKFSIQIMNLTYNHGGIRARTVLWGEMIWKWEYTNSDQALADPWIQNVMRGFGKERCIVNMLNVNGLGSPTDPDFLAKIRDKEGIFLFDELLKSSKKVESLRAAWEKRDGAANGVNPPA